MEHQAICSTSSKVIYFHFKQTVNLVTLREEGGWNCEDRVENISGLIWQCAFRLVCIVQFLERHSILLKASDMTSIYY